MRPWKWLGLAAIVGVAGVGIVVVRNDRSRDETDPDESSARFHGAENSDDGARESGSRRCDRMARQRAAIGATLDSAIEAAAGEIGAIAPPSDQDDASEHRPAED
jgi:hypothetical protein